MDPYWHTSPFKLNWLYILIYADLKWLVIFITNYTVVVDDVNPKTNDTSVIGPLTRYVFRMRRR